MMKIQRLPLDRISDLPRNIIELILIRLPIREALRTSILSSKWRNSWVDIPKLVFDDTMFKGSTGNQLSNKSELFFTIYEILLLHQGPILEFTLALSQLESCSEIDRLIVFLSRKCSVEKFVLQIGKGNDYKLPSSFFSFTQLTHIDLQCCAFEPPSTFKGFSRLTSLKFYNVLITAEILERFIFNCPLLESLTLIADDKHFTGGEKPNFIELFDRLSAIEHLHMSYYPIKCLAAGGVPKTFPTKLINLKILNLSELCFKEVDEFSFALCMIRSSPKLEKIDMLMHTSTDAVSLEVVSSSLLNFIKVQDYSAVSLNKLKEVRMQDITALLPELEFIKLILAKSPMLEKVVLKPHQKKVVGDEELRMLKDLIRFPRASPMAEIILI